MNIKPTATTIDLTEACNLACDYCFTWSKNHKRRSITYDMATKIIDWWLPQTDKNKHNQLSFWGGEPLLEYELMKKLIHYTNDLCKEKDYRINEFGGTTNGLLYTPDKVEWCVKHNSLFLVSLDGIQPVHDKHRKLPSGKGSWKIVDKNLREAIKIAPQQKIRASLSDDTIEYFFENIQYFVEDLGITDLSFSPVFENEWNQKSLDILAEQFDLIINYIIKKAKEGTTIILKHLNDEAHMQKKSIPQNPCGAGNGYTGWSIDGFMFPCHRFNKHGLTTFERANLPTIIARPKGNSFEYCNKEWRNEFIEWKNNVPRQCIECDIFDNSTCNGGCYAVNWDLTDSLYKQPESVCNYNKVQHEAGIKFKKLAEENGIILPKSGWNGQNNNNNKNCICYNLCYNEGTSKEIIHINRSTNMTCICYNTSYNGEANPQVRTVQELDKQRAAELRIIKVAQKMMENI
jgi:uncharacterized protein